MDDAQNVREDGADGVAAGAGDAVMGGQPANEVPAAEAQGVMGGTPDGGTGEDGLAHVGETGEADEDEDEDEVKDNEDVAEEGETPAEAVAAAAEAEEFRRDDTINGPLADTGDRDVEVAEYRITGLVDHFDGQNNIQGQFAVGSVQTLPVEYGSRMVDEGNAEVFVRDETNSDEVQ